MDKPLGVVDEILQICLKIKDKNITVENDGRMSLVDVSSVTVNLVQRRIYDS